MEGEDSVIDLDVGGTRFRTSRQTLLSDPNSMLQVSDEQADTFE